jgi:hypothetical protein
VEGVEEKDNVVFDGYTVEKYGYRGSVESVRHKSRLNHYKRIVNFCPFTGKAWLKSSSA